VAETPEPAIPKTPDVALEEAADLADGERLFGLADSSAEQVRRLLGHVRGLVTAILERTAPVDGDALGYARIELIAVAALLRDARRHDAVSLVVELVRGLVAIQEREEGGLTPNEVILLVRA
jgi:hypothetical protein